MTAYAVYFDHRRRTDPDFRKQLKRESKKQVRAAKEEAEAHTSKQRQALKAAVDEAKEEGFPIDVEEKEAYFMNEVARGEQLAQDGKYNPLKFVHPFRDGNTQQRQNVTAALIVIIISTELHTNAFLLFRIR